MVRNMNYIGYTSVISGGDNPLVYEYVDYCYGAEEDDTDVIEYPVGFSLQEMMRMKIISLPLIRNRRTDNCQHSILRWMS